MTKISLRAWCLYLSFGVPLAASCARETNSNEPGAGTGSQSSAGSRAGSTTVSGSNSVAGTTGNAFGGTNASGGSGAGGSSGAGPGEHEGGDTSMSGGDGATGGSGGSAGIPPDVLMRANAVVYYETQQVAASTTKIQMKLNIKNQSPDPLPMPHVKIRYWLTAEHTGMLHNYYSGDDTRPTQLAFVDAGERSYVEMTFAGAASISQGDVINRSEVQLEVTNDSMAFDQSDDFSWDPTALTSKPNLNITLYLDDQLIWGCEPSGECFDDGGGGAGGQGGGGEAGQAGAGQAAGGQGSDAAGQGGMAP